MGEKAIINVLSGISLSKYKIMCSFFINNFLFPVILFH